MPISAGMSDRTAIATQMFEMAIPNLPTYRKDRSYRRASSCAHRGLPMPYKTQFFQYTKATSLQPSYPVVLHTEKHGAPRDTTGRHTNYLANTSRGLWECSVPPDVSAAAAAQADVPVSHSAVRGGTPVSRGPPEARVYDTWRQSHAQTSGTWQHSSQRSRGRRSGGLVPASAAAVAAAYTQREVQSRRYTRSTAAEPNALTTSNSCQHPASSLRRCKPVYYEATATRGLIARAFETPYTFGNK